MSRMHASQGFEVEYIGFQTVKKAELLAQTLQNIIQGNRYGEQILRFYVQKHMQTGRGGYWAFLAVTKGAQLPDDLNRYFADHSIKPQKKRFNDKEVYKMLAPRTFDLNQPNPILNYQKPQRPRELIFGSTPDIETEANLQETKLQNNALTWLSAQASGTWETFKKLVVQLGLVETPGQCQMIIRNLQTLGHIEISDDGVYWSITPPAWVKSTTTTGDWFLAGSRAGQKPDTLKRQEQPGGRGPDRWSTLFQIPTENIAGNVGLELARHLKDLCGWKEALPSRSISDLSQYRFARWSGQEYKTLDHHIISEPGLYRIESKNERFKRSFQLYFDADHKIWRQADWSGLRLLSDYEHAIPIEWIYSSSNQNLQIRADQRLPLIYEKALVMASGLLPISKNGWLSYQGIDIELAEILAEHCSAEIERQ